MKKGSLNLSIQAIVIVVLGMTLLGLGLGFIRNQFTTIGDIGTEVQGQVREQIISQLRTSGEQVSFPRSVDISRNKAKVLTLGVQNTGSKELKFQLVLNFDVINSDPGYDQFNLRYDRSCLSLSPAQSEVYGINVIAPPVSGTFALNALVRKDPGDIDDDNNPTTPTVSCLGDNPLLETYASKLSFISVG